MRCERCRTSDLTLVSFGVYQCPVCGTVDADGNVLETDRTEPSARGDATQPNVREHAIVDVGRASFAAPPPVSPASLAMMSAAPATSPPTSGRDLPKLFLATLVVLGMIDVASAVEARSFVALLLQATTMGALVTGKSWARTLAIAGAVLMIGLSAMLFVFVHGRAPYGIASIVEIVVNGWWLYVLLRPETVAYFSR